MSHVFLLGSGSIKKKAITNQLGAYNQQQFFSDCSPMASQNLQLLAICSVQFQLSLVCCQKKKRIFLEIGAEYS